MLHKILDQHITATRTLHFSTQLLISYWPKDELSNFLGNYLKIWLIFIYFPIKHKKRKNILLQL